jgi:glycosyltransferase involved in cell wall biosynthesis
MASKKAMVVSNIGWANEMLDDCKSAYLVNPRDHQLFASRIIEFIRNSERRQQFGDAAQKKILDVFDFSVVAHQNIEFYNALLLK